MIWVLMRPACPVLLALSYGDMAATPIAERVMVAIALKRRMAAGDKIAMFFTRHMTHRKRKVRDVRERAAVLIQSAIRGTVGRRRARVYRQLRSRNLAKLGLHGRPLRTAHPFPLISSETDKCAPKGSCWKGGGKNSTLCVGGGASSVADKWCPCTRVPGASNGRFGDVSKMLVQTVGARRFWIAGQEKWGRVPPINAKRNQIFHEKRKILALRRQQDRRKERLHRHSTHLIDTFHIERSTIKSGTGLANVTQRYRYVHARKTKTKDEHFYSTRNPRHVANGFSHHIGHSPGFMCAPIATFDEVRLRTGRRRFDSTDLPSLFRAKASAENKDKQVLFFPLPEHSDDRDHTKR